VRVRAARLFHRALSSSWSRRRRPLGANESCRRFRQHDKIVTPVAGALPSRSHSPARRRAAVVDELIVLAGNERACHLLSGQRRHQGRPACKQVAICVRGGCRARWAHRNAQHATAAAAPVDCVAHVSSEPSSLIKVPPVVRRRRRRRGPRVASPGSQVVAIH
jgi:hypothetical protein